MTRFLFPVFAAFLSAYPALGDMTKESAGGDSKEWMKLTQPSEGHKLFNDLVGKWTYTSKFWMKPDAKAEESKGTMTAKLAFGGRFLQQEVKGKMQGQKFEGMGLLGYDNVRQEYQTVWFDNMATGMMIGTGQYDAAAKLYKEEMVGSCPMTGDKQKATRSELKLIDKKRFTYEMFSKTVEGNEFKAMEITYQKM